MADPGLGEAIEAMANAMSAGLDDLPSRESIHVVLETAEGLGWRLVPRDWSVSMCEVGRRAIENAPDLGGIVLPYTAEACDCWQAMWDAA